MLGVRAALWLLKITLEGDRFCWFIYGIAFAALVGSHNLEAALVFGIGVIRAIHPHVLARIDRRVEESTNATP